MARRSAAGSREEIGCGVAPSFHAAIMASKKPIPFGSPMVTSESGVTPSARKTRASRFVRASSAAREIVTSSHVTAGKLGADCASCPTRTPNGVCVMAVFGFGELRVPGPGGQGTDLDCAPARD